MVSGDLVTYFCVKGLNYYGRSEETRELLGEKDNARNNAWCTQARKATHGLDGQHQDVDRPRRGRVNHNDRGQRYVEKVRPWCGQPSDRGRLKNRTECREGAVVGRVGACRRGLGAQVRRVARGPS